MENEVIFNVRAASEGEFARKVRALKRLAEETTEDPSAGGEDQPLPPDAAPRPGGLIDVGEASGTRGMLVAVELRGHVDIPTMGFAAAIGFETRDLAFVGVKWPELWGAAEVLAEGARDRDHPFSGNAGPHVVLNIARFKFALGAEGPEGGETLPPVMLAQGTLLATLVFKIQDAAKVGRALPLLNRSRLFGRPKVIAEFTRLDGPAVEPALEDGQVVVMG